MSAFTFNFPGGAISVPLPLSAVTRLESELQVLIDRFRTASAQTGKKIPQPNMEYCYREGIYLELFCNPNLWPSPFAARVLMTFKADEFRVSAELELSQLREDIQQYHQAN